PWTSPRPSREPRVARSSSGWRRRALSMRASARHRSRPRSSWKTSRRLRTPFPKPGRPEPRGHSCRRWPSPRPWVPGSRSSRLRSSAAETGLSPERRMCGPGEGRFTGFVRVRSGGRLRSARPWPSPVQDCRCRGNRLNSPPRGFRLRRNEVGPAARGHAGARNGESDLGAGLPDLHRRVRPVRVLPYRFEPIRAAAQVAPGGRASKRRPFRARAALGRLGQPGGSLAPRKAGAADREDPVDRAGKKELVAALNAALKATNVVVVAHYSGLTVAQM